MIPCGARPASSSPAVPGWAMASAALSPVVMIGGWLAAEALQPPSYSPVRSTISGLAGLGGTGRWIMTSALFVVGACYFVTAAGLPGVRVPARIVLMVAGLSSIGIAVSPEPVRGSTPQHLAWTSLGAVAITLWPAFTARRAPSQPLILRARGAGAVTAVFLALLAWLVFETQGGTALGLAERLVSAVQVTWPFVVALALRRAAGRGDTVGGFDLPATQQIFEDYVVSHGLAYRNEKRAQGARLGRQCPSENWPAHDDPDCLRRAHQRTPTEHPPGGEATAPPPGGKATRTRQAGTPASEQSHDHTIDHQTRRRIPGRSQPHRGRHPGPPARPDPLARPFSRSPGGTAVPRPGPAALPCQRAARGRFHPHAHLRVTPTAAPVRSVPRKNKSQPRPGPYYRARTWRPAEEMTVKQIRIERPRARREHPGREVLPPDPRDPDVVRAKALARGRKPRRQVTG